MRKKLIDCHNKWAKDGCISGSGLCNSVPDKYRKSLALFEPTQENYKRLIKQGKSVVFWAHENKSSYFRATQYGKLRQAIVLLICAMHDEI